MRKRGSWFGHVQVTSVIYVFGRRFLTSPHPAAILHQYLGRQLGDRVSAVHDELVAAMEDAISVPDNGGEFIGIPVLKRSTFFQTGSLSLDLTRS